MCVLNGFLKYESLDSFPSIRDLRRDVVNRIERNRDPVIRTIHLNEHGTRMSSQAGFKSCNKSSAPERYSYAPINETDSIKLEVTVELLV